MNQIWLARSLGETSHIHQMQRWEDVAQIKTETLLSVCGRQSGDLALKKGQPCGDGMATEVGTFSGNVRL